MAQSIEIKEDGSWVFHGGDSGDSRMRDPEKNAIPNYRIWNPISGQFEYQTVYRTYCRACGKETGISARQAVYVVYLCDDCYATNQDPSFVAMPPDEEFRWRQGLPAADKEEGIKVVSG